MVENMPVAEARYTLPTSPGSACTIRYELNAEGVITVTMRLAPGKDLPVIPEIGVLFAMPGAFHTMGWYGNGPHESYWDRQEGVKLGFYEGDVADQYEPHILPQENGNKTGVRSAFIHNGRHALFIQGRPEIEMSVLPYTPEEVEGCKHAHLLPESKRTVVRINHHQMGVGGDRCWGATPVAHPPYLLYANRAYTYSFTLRGGDMERRTV